MQICPFLFFFTFFPTWYVGVKRKFEHVLPCFMPKLEADRVKICTITNSKHNKANASDYRPLWYLTMDDKLIFQISHFLVLDKHITMRYTCYLSLTNNRKSQNRISFSVINPNIIDRESCLMIKRVIYKFLV